MKNFKATKFKTCKARDPSTGLRCNSKFEPRSPWQVACSPECSLRIVEAEKAKKAAKELREAKLAIKPKSEWMKEAQTAFNGYIRQRDKDEPCISCGRHHSGQYHAGHFRTTKSAPELRFEPLNCWKQCQPCNTHLSGNILAYRARLVEMLGTDLVAWLEGHHEPKRYKIEDLQEIITLYRSKLKALKSTYRRTENERGK